MVDKIQKCKDEIVTRKRIQLGTFISEYSVRNKNDFLWILQKEMFPKSKFLNSHRKPVQMYV